MDTFDIIVSVGAYAAVSLFIVVKGVPSIKASRDFWLVVGAALLWPLATLLPTRSQSKPKSDSADADHPE